VWLPAWLPAAGDHHALVLVTTIGPLPVARPRLALVQAPPPNPTAAEPPDGRILSRSASRVHQPPAFTEAVALRSQPGLTGSGSPVLSHGGFGGGHPHFRLHADCRHPGLTELNGQLRSEAELPAARRHRGLASAVLLPELSLPPLHCGEDEDHRSPEGHQRLCRVGQQREAARASSCPPATDARRSFAS